MTHVIWEFHILPSHQEISLPSFAQILGIQTQVQTEDESNILVPTMWVLVDTDQPIETRKFYTIGTGYEIDKEIFHRLKYISTFQLGPYVFHTFEITSVGVG